MITLGVGAAGLVGAPGSNEMEREEAVAIVDPYTSGRFLVEEFRRRGWPLVAVRSSLAIDEALLGTWNPAPFERVVVHHGNVSETAQASRQRRPVRAVLAGSEPGVALADQLAAELKLRGNDPELPRPRCRWDKYEMHARLSECGLRACRQRLCGCAQEAAAFAAELGTWPVVVKPRTSHGGGGGVSLCGDVAALEEAVAAIRASKDFTGCANDVALVQEFLDGTEYVVDCVSLDGDHFVSATWVYRKTPTECGFAYDRTQTLPYDNTEGSLQQRLYAYVFQCLTALGVQNGASHSEVVFSEKGPCLVRLGARMHGSMGPALWARCAGREQAQPFLLADLYTEGARLLARRLAEVGRGAPAYKLSQVSVQVDLQCPAGGVLDQSVEASSGVWLRALPTFNAMRLFVEEGDRVAPTRDLFSSPGFVVLLGDCEKEVDRDVAAIRAREQSGQMYVLREAPHNGNADGVKSAVAARRNSIPAARLRELEAEAEKLISPLASRAASPVLSPQQAPALPPEMGDDLVEFTLNGDGLDDFDLDGGGAGADFSLDGGGVILPPGEPTDGEQPRRRGLGLF